MNYSNKFKLVFLVFLLMAVVFLSRQSMFYASACNTADVKESFNYSDIKVPLIPHSTEGYIVNKEQNDCLTCHLEGMKHGEEHFATKMSHEYTGEEGEETVTDYNNCLQCHITQAG